VDDEEFLARAEQALTEIKIGRGSSDHHEAVRRARSALVADPDD
jgi:hypothetical protein